MAGIGLRQPHYQAVMAQLPPLDFLEVHSENFFGDGGGALALLLAARQHYEISLHGVGLSLGSACGVDPLHLDQLARLVDRIDPVRVSDHASFARGPGMGPGTPWVHASDLLPVAFTNESLDIMARNIEVVQTRLRRSILVENLSAYLSYADDTIAEPQFLSTLCERSGCQLLLDINNLVVNGLNQIRQGDGPLVKAGLEAQMLAAGQFACNFVRALKPSCVGEVHLAGFSPPQEADQVIVDDHSRGVQPVVWQCYREAMRLLGHQPTLIEWDTDVPDLAVLLDQARLADEAAP